MLVRSNRISLHDTIAAYHPSSSRMRLFSKAEFLLTIRSQMWQYIRKTFIRKSHTCLVSPILLSIRSQAASCSSSKALTYSWSVRCTNDDSSNAAKTRFESSPGFRETSSKSALKVDSGALVGGKTYEFTVTVALKESPSTATNMTTTVMVDWSPLEPAIVGGLYHEL